LPAVKNIAASNGHVYAGGSLVNASGKYYVAEWDGSAWSELGGTNSSGLNGYIWALALNSHGDLYVGGQFTNANGDAYVAVYKEQLATTFIIAVKGGDKQVGLM